jgi:hypothetical protein
VEGCWPLSSVAFCPNDPMPPKEDVDGVDETPSVYARGPVYPKRDVVEVVDGF